MTKEELKKEAEVYANGYATPDLEASFRAYMFEASKEGYIAGAEPREKRITELEKENAELKEQNKNLQVMLQVEREVRVNEDYLKKITDLEAENEELKTDYEVLSCSVGDFGELQDKLEEEQRKNNVLSDNLTKAKELLKQWLQANICDSVVLFSDTEQFLNSEMKK